MTRRPALFLRSLAMVLLAGFVFSGCPDNPYDPATWIDKLDDRSQVRKAVTELQRLKNEPGIENAIEPLAKTWEKQNRPQKILRVIIELAEEGKGGPHWDKAVPVLRTAVDEFDIGDDRSIQNAIMAADALGRAKDKDSIQTLIRAVNKKMPKLSGGQRVRLAAISALGKFGQDEKRAVDALLQVLNADPEGQVPNLFAAAALALADARSPSAIDPLIMAMFKIGAIYPQCRRALIAIGDPVIPRLLKIFKGQDKELNQFAKDKDLNVGCDKSMGPDTSCQAPTNLEYKSAMLLGDFYSEKAVGPLLQGLKKTPMPAFFEQGIPGPDQHTAILDALRKIGDFKAGDAVWEYANNSDTDDGIRPLAIDVYSFLTAGTESLPGLAKMIKDDDAEEQVRMAAGITYGRLVRSAKDYGPILYMIDRYKKEANKREGAVKKAERAYEAAKKKYGEAKKKADENKDNEKLAARAKKAKSEMDVKQREKAMAEGRVAGYRNFQRTFEQNLVRAHVGVTCKRDPQCYVGILDKKADDIGKELSKYLKDWDDWSDQDKTNLKVAAVDRALLEIRKLGAKARPVTDKLLEKVDSEDRITRQGILLALVKIAELPCEKCVKRLEEVVAEQKEQSTLQSLTVETEAVRNYFLWAGK